MKWILHRENRCQELLKRTSSSKRGASFRTRFLNFFLFFSMSIYSREDTFSLFSLSLSLDFLNVTCNNILFFLRFYVFFVFGYRSYLLFLWHNVMFFSFFFFCVNNGIDVYYGTIFGSEWWKVLCRLCYIVWNASNRTISILPYF